MSRESLDPVRIIVEIALHTVYRYQLCDITGNQPVKESLLGKVLIIINGAFVREKKSAADISLDSFLVGREREKQFMEPFDMLPRLDGTVLGRILRKRQNQRLAVIQNIYFLSLFLCEPERRGNRIDRNGSTGDQKQNRKKRIR